MQLSETEKWVVDQIAAGADAYVDIVFPVEKRKIGAPFLEELLGGELSGVKPHRNGIRIIGAIIEGSMDLSNAQISCDVWLKNCQFNGPVKFQHASFAGVISLNESTFKANTNFVGMKVGHSVFCNNATFEDTVTFAIAEIMGSLEAREATFKKAVKFNGIKVRVAGDFEHAVFEGPVDFGLADFTWLDLSTAFWPKSRVQFRMQGLTYKYVSAVPGNEVASHEALLKLADRSMYSADVYANLEEFFLRQGYRADADRAFVMGKHRERQENLHGLSWLGSWVLNLLVGYGRHPRQAMIPCAVFVTLGCILFATEKMELQEKPNAGDPVRVYNRFWYSLGLFLPFVNLQTAELWKPKTDQTFLRNYVRVHILLGWILIPIVLAALTGLIK